MVPCEDARLLHGSGEVSTPIVMQPWQRRVHAGVQISGTCRGQTPVGGSCVATCVSACNMVQPPVLRYAGHLGRRSDVHEPSAWEVSVDMPWQRQVYLYCLVVAAAGQPMGAHCPWLRGGAVGVLGV